MPIQTNSLKVGDRILITSYGSLYEAKVLEFSPDMSFIKLEYAAYSRWEECSSVHVETHLAPKPQLDLKKIPPPNQYQDHRIVFKDLTYGSMKCRHLQPIGACTVCYMEANGQ